MADEVENPFPFYTDRNGDALDEGYVYIGVADQDPELFPQATFWDADLTVPSLQPLRTDAGYVVNPGAGNSVAHVYTAGAYSIRVRNKLGVQVLYAPNVAPPELAPELAGPNGSTLVGFIHTGTDATLRTVQSKLRDLVSPMDYGAVGNGVVNDDTALLNAAATHPWRLFTGSAGIYRITTNLPAGFRMLDGTVLDSRMVTADDEYSVLALGEFAGTSITYIPEQFPASGGRAFAAGNHLVYLGWGAGRYNSIGRRNTLVGSRAGAAGSTVSPTTFNYTTGVGSQAFESLTTGVENCAFGTQAMQTTTTGYGNACFGLGSGLRLTEGFYNSYFGYSSGPSNTVPGNADGGSYNVGIGYRAHYVNEDGTNCVAIGADSLVSATSADDCIGIGRNALLNVVNDIAIIGIGTDALRNTVGATESLGVGQEVLKAQTTGSKNSAFGWQAGLSITTAGNNALFGYRAGYTIAGATGDQGAFNTCLGASTGASLITGDRNTLVGYGSDTIAAATNSTALGNGASCTGSDQVTLGNGAITTLRAAVTTITAISDQRFKDPAPETDGRFAPEMGKDLVRSLIVRDFRWNENAAETHQGRREVGLFAQEVQETLAARGIDWMEVVTPGAGMERPWEMAPGKLLMPVIAALQKAFEENDDLRARVDALEALAA